MVYLDPSTEKMAAELATCLDESLSGKSIQVLHNHLQYYFPQPSYWDEPALVHS